MKSEQFRQEHPFLLKCRDLYNYISGKSIQHDLTTYQKKLQQIRNIDLSQFSDHRLLKKSIHLAGEVQESGLNDCSIIEGFALVVEAIRRKLKIDVFDVQIMAGIALWQQKLVQMNTGEGKTISAVFPAYLNALFKKGVHVLTANNYLARRDCEWMQAVYGLLGLTCCFVNEGSSKTHRKKSYQADITYLTARECGFDYLRDLLCHDSLDLVQRPFYFAVIDEADFILIDEARVPLVIARDTKESQMAWEKLLHIINQLRPGLDYQVDTYGRNVFLTEKGVIHLEKKLGYGDLSRPKHIRLMTLINLSLHAKALLKRDKDYIVRDGKIELVDEFTGRVADRRRWPHGIHPAVEAKEGVQIQKEGEILSSIAIQHFINCYPKISAMTATALPSADEFKTFYGLDIVVIPPHKTNLRIDEQDCIFKTKEQKIRAIIEEIKAVHEKGRPILLGTCSVKESEILSQRLLKEGIQPVVLNAKNDAKEAKIIARAGELNAVTISTNMAGRGTDIILGGLKQHDREKIIALGGLYVIGTNRHESVRIDMQLRGRAGRQGDPGSSRFFLSLEDDLISRYNVLNKTSEKNSHFSKAGQVLKPMINQEVVRAQRIIEDQNFQIRRTLWAYSSLVEKQRKIVHNKRQRLLNNKLQIGLLAKEAAQTYQKWLDLIGQKKIEKAEKSFFLYYIDRYWSTHLQKIEDIREGIHLHSLSGKNPMHEFIKQVDQAYQRMGREIEIEVIHTFEKAPFHPHGLDMVIKQLQRPATTWTYLLNDHPFSQLGISIIASRNIGLAAGAGALAAQYLPVIMVVWVIKIFKGLIKKMKRMRRISNS